METRNRNSRIGPLPGGDRRGTSAAGHGRDSMLASDSRNSDWAGAGDRGVGERSSEVTVGRRSSRSRTATPVDDVLQEARANQFATTKTGKPRERMKWDEEINIFIMRTYYYITKLDTDRTMYCSKLYDNFVQKYPHLKVSSQRIADQRRVIVRNKLLSENILENIKREVALLLKSDNNEQPNNLETVLPPILEEDSNSILQNPSNQTDTVFINNHAIVNIDTPPQTTLSPYTISTQENTSSDIIDPQYIEKFKDELETALAEYRGTDPTSRPKLPRLKENKKLYKLVRIFNNNILDGYCSIDLTITQLHTLVYCSAIVISRNLGYKVKTQNENSDINDTMNREKPAWQIRIEKDIRKLRADIGRLQRYINNNRSSKLEKKVQQIFKNTKIHSKYEKNNVKPE